MYRMRRLLGEEIGVFLNPKIKSFLTGTKRISVQLVMNMLYTSKINVRTNVHSSKRCDIDTMVTLQNVHSSVN